MTLLKLPIDRFTIEDGYLVRLEVPVQNRQQVMEAVKRAASLKYGDYDMVSFTISGIQNFRSLGGGHNPRKDTISEWDCVEETFFLPLDDSVVEDVFRAIYSVHPSEEPVMQVVRAARPLHIRGLDEDNPNRFWNRKDSVEQL